MNKKLIFLAVLLMSYHFQLISKIVSRPCDRRHVCNHHAIELSTYDKLFPYEKFFEKEDFGLITPVKTGTHLAIKLLNLLTGNMGSGALGLYESHGKKNPQMNLDLEKKHKFSVQHFYFQENLESHLNSPRKSISVVRDPRDALVSLCYQIQKDTQGFEKLTISEILDMFLEDRRTLGEATDFRFQYQSLITLIETKKEVHILSYEALVGDRGGGNKQKQQMAIRKLGQFLGLPLNKNQLNFLSENLYGQAGKNIFGDHGGWTFRKGKIGSWKEEFQDRHKRKFKEQYNDLLLYFGYENQEDWG